MTQEQEAAKKALITGALALAAALLTARALDALVDFAAPMNKPPAHHDGKRRKMELLAALPEIASLPGEKAVVLGPSNTFYGFSPKDFDSRMKLHGIPLQSYNLGIGGSNPKDMRILAESLGLEFQKLNGRLVFAAVEFAPAAASERFRLTRERENSLLKKIRGRSGIRKNIRRLQQLLHKQPAAAPAGPAWDFSLRGGLELLSAEGIENYKRRILEESNPRVLAASFSAFNHAMDYQTAVFSEEMLREFIETVRQLQLISDQVVVFTTPRRISWIKHSPAAQERIRAALERIRMETQAPVFDFYSNPRFREEDFLDLVHLNEISGRPLFNALLADAAAGKMP